MSYVEHPDRRRFAVPFAMSMAIGALAFATLLPLPFLGDQALFVVFARGLDDGAVLYRDLWDLKQPAIYLFYLAGGRLFGFSEVGIHSLDLIASLLFAGMLGLALRREVGRAWVAAIAPAALLGVYALVAHPSELTQAENVVGPLVFAVAWFAWNPLRWGPIGPFLSGLFAGVVLLFKFYYLPLILAVWITVAVFRRRDGDAWASVVVRDALPAAAGTAIPLVLLAAYVLSNDLVDIVRFTYFEYPPQAASLSTRPISRLVYSLGGYFLPLAPFVALAGYRVSVGNRGRGGRLTILMVVWLAMSLVLFAFQPWWSYYLYLGYIPLIVLGLQGLDDALDRVRPRRVWTTLAILALPLVMLGALRIIEEAPPLLRGEGISGLQTAVSEDHERARAVLSRVPPIDQQPVYVLGNPIILHLGDARQAVPVNGWSPEFWTEFLWEWATTDLETMDVTFLFIAEENATLAASEYPAFLTMVERAYTPYAATEDGRWYLAGER